MRRIVCYGCFFLSGFGTGRVIRSRRCPPHPSLPVGSSRGAPESQARRLNAELEQRTRAVQEAASLAAEAARAETVCGGLGGGGARALRWR